MHSFVLFDSPARTGEECDDGNTNSNDGCSAFCVVECGFTCDGSVQPLVCQTVCGDGARTSNEECDDSNVDNGDGCSSTCTLESGWECINLGDCERANCTICAAGTYELNNVCEDCLAGKWLPNLGSYSSADCTACGKGKYSSSPGATSEDSCVSCVSGKYLDVTGSDAEEDCEACPTNSNNNFAASDDVTDCMCDAGSTGPNGDPCALCAKGKYKASAGDMACDECAQGKYLDVTGSDAETDCEACPANSGNNPAASDEVTDCICDAGSTGPDGGPCVNAFIASPDCPFVDCDTVTCKCDTVTCKMPKLAS